MSSEILKYLCQYSQFKRAKSPCCTAALSPLIDIIG